ncbi:hypothetical protein K3495_g5977 [Podosphaera aphanis]|nr:hypothetical protein K3495_g5977 [Podosphaera aphanis]
MLPTPSTSHVHFERVYEPAEDTYLFLDTLSSDTEKAFLRERLSAPRPHQGQYDTSPAPLIVEIGSGSGMVISFMHVYCGTILGRSDILTASVDVNSFACSSTNETVKVAEAEEAIHGFYLGSIRGDLTSSLRPAQVDVLIFNPPYVPTAELPSLPTAESSNEISYENDSHLLSLSYAGGRDGMEATDRLLDSLSTILSHGRGCAYVLLCTQNKPEEVKKRVRSWGAVWSVETVGQSGNHAGWEKLQIIRIWRTEIS